MKRATVRLIPLLALLPCTANALTIDFSLGAGFNGQNAAVGALQRAAAQWTTRLSDPITVTIQTNLQNFNQPNIIGGASSVTLTTTNDGFNLVRNALVQDAANEADDAVVAALPSLNQFSANLPAGFSLSGEIAGTKANFKAMGFTGLDSIFGATDATILFNSGFAFDFDNGNGVGAALMDFETVAAHEIGHVLGFVSAVDDIDLAHPGAISPLPLDLFRFALAGTPTSLSQFTALPRELRPAVEAVTSDTVTVLRMSTGEQTGGDGRQASHFKDDAFAGIGHIGIMDPTLAFGQSFTVTAADLRALDLVGYEYASVSAVPLPAAWWSMTAALGVLAGFRRRKLSRPLDRRDPEQLRVQPDDE